MSEVRSLARRLSGFTGLPLLSLLTPFLLLPLVARIGGVQVWAGFSIGQAIGTLASILIAFGWTLVGPSRVAELADSTPRATLYASSVISRMTLLVLAAPAGVLATVLLVHSDVVLISTLTTLAFALGGLSPSWFCVGIGRPGLIARYELLPRVVATAVAAALILLTGAVFLYPVLLIAASLYGQVGFVRSLGGRMIFRGVRITQAMRDLWQQRAAAGANLAAGAYSSTPVALVGITGNATAVALFASAEKLYRISLFTVSALSNTFQGWVSEGTGRARKMRIAVCIHLVWGLVGCLGLSIAGPFTTRVLFGADLAADAQTCFWFGLAFAAVSVNSALGRHVLIPMKRAGAVFVSTLAGAAVGVPAVFLLSVAYGGSGGAMGLFLGELTVCLVQGALILVLFRRVGPGGSAEA